MGKVCTVTQFRLGEGGREGYQGGGSANREPDHVWQGEVDAALPFICSPNSASILLYGPTPLWTYPPWTKGGLRGGFKGGFKGALRDGQRGAFKRPF